MNYSDIQNKLQNLKYPKEVDLGKEKLVFYYNNKARAQEGGVFVYKVKSETIRPEKKNDLTEILSEGRTTCFSGIPYYTMDLHKTLFDTRNRLF